MGCKERSCLEKGEDAVAQVVREVNKGWCKIDLSEDDAVFVCDDAILSGTVTDRVFDLRVKAPGVDLSLNNAGLYGACGRDVIELHDQEHAKEIAQIRSNLRQILRDLELD